MEDWVSCYAVSLDEDYKKGENHGVADYFKEDETKGEGDENFNAVSFLTFW